MVTSLSGSRRTAWNSLPWVHEWEKLNSGTQADGLKFPDHLPEGFPTRRKPPEHPWTKSTSCK